MNFFSKNEVIKSSYKKPESFFKVTVLVNFMLILEIQQIFKTFWNFSFLVHSRTIGRKSVHFAFKPYNAIPMHFTDKTWTQFTAEPLPACV